MNKIGPAGQPILSRPKNKSLKAFKAWIKETNKKFGGKETLTEAQYKAGWKKFWSKK